MEGNTYTIQDDLPYDEALLKRNRIILFALNAALVLPYAIRHFSPIGAGISLVLLLLAFFLTVMRADASLPAITGLPILGAFDALILMALSYEELLLFLPQSTEDIAERVDSNATVGILLIGIILCVLRLKGRAQLWIKALGWIMFIGYFTVQAWVDYALPSDQAEAGLKASMLFVPLCVLAWFCICAVSHLVDEDTLKRDRWLSRLLLTVYAALSLAEHVVLEQHFFRMYDWILHVSDVGFAWWKVLLAAGALVGCAVASYDLKNSRMGPDSAFLAGAGGLVLLTRVLMSRYFICGWLILLVCLAGSFRCLRNELKQAKTLHLSSPVYLAAQTGVLLVAVCLLKRGIWITVLCMAIYALVFNATAGKMKSAGRKLCLWLILLSCPAVLAAGTIWHLRFLPASLLLLTVMFAVLALVVVLLHWPNPTGQTCPGSCKWVVFGVMSLLSLLVCFRFGTRVEVTFQSESQTAHIELEARGKDNELVSAVCTWSSFTGEPLDGGQRLKEGASDIPIRGERLTIVATDAFGATTTVTDWYPPWIWEGR